MANDVLACTDMEFDCKNLLNATYSSILDRYIIFNKQGICDFKKQTFTVFVKDYATYIT